MLVYPVERCGDRECCGRTLIGRRRIIVGDHFIEIGGLCTDGIIGVVERGGAVYQQSLAIESVADKVGLRVTARGNPIGG